MKYIFAIILFLSACTQPNPYPFKAVVIKNETFPHAAARIFDNEKMHATGEPRYLNFGDTITILGTTDDKVVPMHKFKTDNDSGFVNIIFVEPIF